MDEQRRTDGAELTVTWLDQLASPESRDKLPRRLEKFTLLFLIPFFRTVFRARFQYPILKPVFTEQLT